MTRLAMNSVKSALAFFGALAVFHCSKDGGESSPGSLVPGEGMPANPDGEPTQSIDPLLPEGMASGGEGVNFGELDTESSNGGSSAEGVGPTCLGETREAEQVGLDIFIMLDTSASMLDPLPGQAAGAAFATKWDAVRSSLEAFVQSAEAAEIGIGLQYFPQMVPDVPFTCVSSDQCGAIAGPCSNSLCVVEDSRDDDPDDLAPPLTFIRITDDGRALLRRERLHGSRRNVPYDVGRVRRAARRAPGCTQRNLLEHESGSRWRVAFAPVLRGERLRRAARDHVRSGRSLRRPIRLLQPQPGLPDGQHLPGFAVHVRRPNPVQRR
jgi:hypothetical protein